MKSSEKRQEVVQGGGNLNAKAGTTGKQNPAGKTAARKSQAAQGGAKTSPVKRKPMATTQSEAIAALAYSFYEQDGRIDGRDLEHWFRAVDSLTKNASA